MILDLSDLFFNQISNILANISQKGLISQLRALFDTNELKTLLKGGNVDR